MAHTIKSEELNAEISLPKPFTGAHYMAWVEAYNKSDGNMVLRGIVATLAIIDKGFYIEGGVEHDLKARGMDAPLHILVWVQGAGATYVAEAMDIPKASSPQPQPQPTKMEKLR